MKNAFIAAIHSKNKVLVSFHSKEDEQVIDRKCAPMDYGPIRNSKDNDDRFHFWDFESDKKPHPLLLRPEQIVRIKVLQETFEPRTFVTWVPMWMIRRNW